MPVVLKRSENNWLSSKRLEAIDYRIVPGSFPNPVVSVGLCYTAVDAVAGGLTTG